MFPDYFYIAYFQVIFVYVGLFISRIFFDLFICKEITQSFFNIMIYNLYIIIPSLAFICTISFLEGKSSFIRNILFIVFCCRLTTKYNSSLYNPEYLSREQELIIVLISIFLIIIYPLLMIIMRNTQREINH